MEGFYLPCKLGASPKSQRWSVNSLSLIQLQISRKKTEIYQKANRQTNEYMTQTKKICLYFKFSVSNHEGSVCFTKQQVN